MSSGMILQQLSRYNIGTFAHVLHRHALLRPDKEALVYGPQRLDYAELNARVNRLAHALEAKGLKKGDGVGILAWNCLDYVVIYGAAAKGGYILSRFSPRLLREELEYMINYSEISALCVGPELVELTASLAGKIPNVKHLIAIEEKQPGMDFLDDLLAAQPADEPDNIPEEDDRLQIIYTSGTTGVPRGALYTNRHVWEDTRTLVIDMALQPSDRHLQIAPLFHIAGDTIMRSLLYQGACNVIAKSFDPAAVLQTIHDEKISHLQIVPTHLIAMLGLPDVKKYDLSSLRMMWYGASPMPVELLKRGMETFGPIFTQGYGQSESGPAIAHLPCEEHNVIGTPRERILGSVGHPDMGVQVRIVDEHDKDLPPGEPGEIIVRSKHRMQEYWHKPEDTAATIVDGWLHTGDVGVYDEEGYIYIVDRKKDLIISGGENIYPREVEEVLYRMEAVHEVAVIGVPDPYWVERVHAVICLKPGCTCTADDVKAFCKQHLAGFKAPKSVAFVAALPKTATGKILKKDLREMYRE